MTVTSPPLVTPTAYLASPATDPDDPAWHEARALGIGSSDAAAILGLDPWNSLYGLWLAKTGRTVRDGESEPMRWGKVLEGPIAEEYGVRAGVRIGPAPGVLAHVEHDWLRASPDRMRLDSEGRPWSFVEVKNVSGWKSGEWDAKAGLAPPHYIVQTMHQLAVTGFDEAAIACLVGGQHLEYLTVERDEALIEGLLEREAAFWQSVVDDVEPPWDGSRQSIEAVRSYRAEPGTVIDLRDEHHPLLEEVRVAKSVTAALRAELKAAEEAEKAAVGALQAVMGTAEVALGEDGEPVCTWKESTRRGYTVAEARIRTFRLA